MKQFICQKKFINFKDIKKALKTYFDLKDAEFYPRGIELLLKRWSKVLENNENYILS